jgi:predicted glycosyltransferase
MNEMQPDTLIQEQTPEGHTVFTFRVTVTVAEWMNARSPYLLVADKVHDLIADAAALPSEAQ